MTAPDPVVAALEAIGRHSAVAGYDGGDATTYALAYAALPLARAQAALVAADVAEREAWIAMMRADIPREQRDWHPLRVAYDTAKSHSIAALADYRRALESM